jgi:hypothetical protein
MMAGPHPTAQSPEPRAVPLPVGPLGLTYLRRQSPLPARLDSVPHPLSFAKARGPYPLQPRHQLDAHFAYNSFRPSTIYHTFKRILQSGAVATSDIPFRSWPPPSLTWDSRSGAELALHRLHSTFPFCTHCLRRPPQADTARPQICQEANTSFVYSVQHSCFPDNILADVT